MQKEKNKKAFLQKQNAHKKVWVNGAKKTINSSLKSYGGFPKNDRRQPMIFYSDLYFKTILGYTTPSAQAN